MSIDKQTVLRDLNSKQNLQTTPLMFSRDSSMDTLSSFNMNFHSHNSTYASEHSTNPSGILSPSDIPDSPPRERDDSINTTEEELLLPLSHEQLQQQQTFTQPLNNTRSTGITVIERSNNYRDDDDHDSIRNYAVTSPIKISYDGDDDDDNNSIHSSLSSLTLPPPTSTSTARTLLTNLNELKRLRHNLSVINEESLHEQNERRKSIFNLSNTTTDDDDDDDDNDQKGKRLLYDLIRQRLPHHHISLSNPSNASATSSSKIHDEQDRNDISKSLSSSSPSVIDQTMREHDLTLPSSTMQESGYDSMLPMGSAPKRSLSNASLSTTRSITIKKKHRCDEENDDPMNENQQTDITDDDDDDEHYDKKAGEALLRNLIAQVLPSFNPRYLNGGDGDENNDEDEILSNPRRPSPTSQAYSSSTASSVRSIDIEINKKTEKNISIRSNKTNMTGIIQQEKIQTKRTNIHRPVQQTKTSELRRLQTQSRR